MDEIVWDLAHGRWAGLELPGQVGPGGGAEVMQATQQRAPT